MKRLATLFYDVIPVIATVMYAGFLIFTPEPTMKQVATLLALVAIMACWHLFITKNISLDLNTVRELKEMAQLVRTQDLMLKELQAANKLNDKTSTYIVSQAEALYRLTSSAVKKKVETTIPGSLPKTPVLPAIEQPVIDQVKVPING